jgi:hypothetical protein
MPFDLVINESTATGQSARVSKNSVCGSWGAVAGTLRYFADHNGVPRASIDGTRIPLEQIKEHATRTAPEIVYDAGRPRAPIRLQSKLDYRGFTLECESTALREFPADLLLEIRQVLARALAQNQTHHPAEARNRFAIEDVRNLYRRSGGATPRLGEEELTAFYLHSLEAAAVDSLKSFQQARLELSSEQFVAPAQAGRLRALPGRRQVAGQHLPVEYDVEETLAADGTRSCRGILRLQLPAALARSLQDGQLPATDRPWRFSVTLSSGKTIESTTLQELQSQLQSLYEEPRGGAAQKHKKAKPGKAPSPRPLGARRHKGRPYKPR